MAPRSAAAILADPNVQARRQTMRAPMQPRPQMNSYGSTGAAMPSPPQYGRAGGGMPSPQYGHPGGGGPAMGGGWAQPYGHAGGGPTMGGGWAQPYGQPMGGVKSMGDLSGKTMRMAPPWQGAAGNLGGAPLQMTGGNMGGFLGGGKGGMQGGMQGGILPWMPKGGSMGGAMGGGWAQPYGQPGGGGSLAMGGGGAFPMQMAGGNMRDFMGGGQGQSALGGGGNMRFADLEGGGSPAMAAPQGQPQIPTNVRTQALTAPGRAPGGGTAMNAPPQGAGGASQTSRQAPRPAPEDRGGLYGGGTDEYGLPYDRYGKKKFKGYGAAKKLRNKGFAWQQDQGMYQQAMDTINEILGRKGQLSPEHMIQEQAGIEQGRGQGQQALQARMAAAGIDPSSPQAMAMGGMVDQAANRMQAENRRALDIQAEQQMRNDLNLPLPWLQAMLSQITKHGGGGVQALPMQTGGGGGTDYAGMLAGLGSSALGAWGNGAYLGKNRGPG